MKKTALCRNQKYFKEEDIQFVIYDSEEDNPTQCVKGQKTAKEKFIEEYRKGKKRFEDSSSVCEKLEERKSIFNILEVSEENKACERRHRYEKEKSTSGILTESKIIYIPHENSTCSTHKELLEDIDSSVNRVDPYFSRKRLSPTGTACYKFPKRFKTNFDYNMINDPVVKMEKKTDVDFEKDNNHRLISRRNINSVMEELESISRKWKEGHSKYKFPTQWGSKITKICVEKWDSHYIPSKIAECCNKYTESEINNANSDTNSNSQTELETNDLRYNACSVEKLDQDHNCDFLIGCSEVETSSPSDQNDITSLNMEPVSKMILRNKGQNRIQNRMDEEVSNEEFKERLGKGKFKKGSSKSRDRKCSSSRKGLENNVRKKNEDENVDCNKNVDNDPKRDLAWDIIGATSSHYEDKSTSIVHSSEDDLVTCPICNENFEKHFIENHATECASTTFKD